MKSIFLIKKNKGIGLIEVLITTVVVATGLLAVASMQSGFMSSSAINKTRAEALTLAEQKIEALKNNIVIADYSAIAASTDSINGVNATFSRTWTINPLTTPTRKSIVVTVTWGAASADERVVLSSEIAFSDPGNSAGIAAYGMSTGRSPSPNQSSSETVNDKTREIFDSNGNLKPGLTNVSGTSIYQDSSGDLYRLNSDNRSGSLVFFCNTLTQFDQDLTSPQNYDATTGALLSTPVDYLYTRRLNLDSVTGSEAIELFTKNFTTTTSGNSVTYVVDGSCTRVHRFFGGVIVSFKGTVHTVNNLDDIKIDFNKQDMFCVFNHGTSQTTRPYACYAAGNCNVSSAGNNSNVNTCPDPSVADAKVGPGGFSGNVGLLNVDDDGAGKESACFKEELDNGPITTPQIAIITPSTARKYKTNNGGAEQGINRSYACQDFYIVGRQANFSKLAAKCAGVVGSLNLPPKEVVRTINGNNVVANTTDDLIDNSYCSTRAATTYDLTINLPSNSGVTYTVTTPGGNCTPMPASTTAICTITTSGTSVEVFAVSNQGSTGSCIIDQLVSATPNRNCSITVQLPPQYTIVGPLTRPNGSPSFEVRAYDSFKNVLCTTTSSTYTCAISTNDSIVELKTINTGGGANNGKIIDYCAQPITINTSTYNPSCSLTSKK